MQPNLPRANGRTLIVRAKLLLLVAMLIAAAPRFAIAQSRNFSAYFLEVMPAKFVATAFAQPYGQEVVTQFAAALSESADPACLRSSGISKEHLAHRARALLLERGSYMLERLVSTIDRAAYKSYLHGRIGSEGVAEFERLRTDPTVRAYMAVDEPAELAFIAQYIVENIRRYAMIMRISFARPFSPLSTDIPSLDNLDPTDKVDAALKKMIAEDMSGALTRYSEMVAISLKPFHDATNTDRAMKFGPGELLARPRKDNKDLYNELVDLCVAGKAGKL
jgi:hypothetical protein